MIAQTTTKIEQAEALIVAMDAAQRELESASDYDLFESCKAQLAGLKSEIEKLGYQAERCVNGWRIVSTQVEEKTMKNAHEIISEYAEQFDGSTEQEKETALALIKEGSVGTFYQAYVYKCLICGCDTHHVMKVDGWEFPVCQASYERVAQAASQPTGELHEDSEGLYASVPSSNGKTTYRVGVCAMWLKTIGCTCASGDFGKDCRHQVQIDAQLRDIRPTFSEWIAGKGASHEVIASLVATPDRYREPLKGSGVTGFSAAEIERKLAA